MLEVHISNIHIRYEDADTQDQPFAAGFKIGFIGVTSKANRKELRTSGEWKHASASRHANPLFCQSIVARRISGYWDVGEARESLLSLEPVAGEEVFRKVVRLNLREAFCACVVEKILGIFPPEHPRRKSLEGPCFRERLDFHQYILFPASLNAHITANRPSDAMFAMKAPLKDADVNFDPVEVALDTEQLRSLNELLAYSKEFKKRDSLIRTRPRESIGTYIDLMKSSQQESSSSTSLGDDLAKRMSKVVQSWWHHAFQAVRIMCGIPKSDLDRDELRLKARRREEYISLCLDELLAAEREKEEERLGTTSGGNTRAETIEKIRDMQIMLPLVDIMNWRLLARGRMIEKLARHSDDDGKEDDEDGGAAAKTAATDGARIMPSTFQVRAHFVTFQAFFLVVADRNWLLMLRKRTVDMRDSNRTSCLSSMLGNTTAKRLTRQLLVKAEVSDVRIEAVQKGRKLQRVARWCEVMIGRITATNCNAKRDKPSTQPQQILSITPYDNRIYAKPVCAYIAINSMKIFDKDAEAGEIPIAAVLNPSEGVAAHLKDFGKEPPMLAKLGFLKDFVDEAGRTMFFVFGRVGQVKALDYTPFRRRLMHFVRRGKDEGAKDLVRRPSPLALDKELLVKLQRRVQTYTGKSDMLSIVEGVTDGVRGRLVDHYNMQHVLCKEVSLAPMRFKALRNGCPQTFQIQFHQMQPKEEQRGSSFGLLSGSSILPWKVGMLLLPKADFAMGLELVLEAGQTEEVREQVNSTRAAGKLRAEPPDPATVIHAGGRFLKWCRNGKAKSRFVIFDDGIEAIVWKSSETDKNPINAIPLSKIQDITTGVQTPVLHKVRGAKLRPDHVFSLIATDRTLDLQAESTMQRDKWVAGLKASYKKYIQRQNVEPEAAPPIPKQLEKRMKTYQEKFRCDLSELRSTYRKLQAVTALPKSLEASKILAESMGRGERQVDDGAGRSKDAEGAGQA